MPNLANAIKALRQDKKRAARNKVKKDAYRKALKVTNKAIAAGEKDLTQHVSTVQKTLGKAVKTGVLKQGTASRKLSRLMKKVNAVKA